MKSRKRVAAGIAALVLTMGLGGCASEHWNSLSPFDNSKGPDLGENSLKPIMEETGGKDNASDARHALEVMGSYRRTQDPQPAYPVVQPAEVRLMWVPDHLNKAGDMVPAHYYYLRVLDDRWGVQDAFDLEDQLNATTQGSKSSGGGAGTATPWVYGEPSKR